MRPTTPDLVRADLANRAIAHLQIAINAGFHSEYR